MAINAHHRQSQLLGKQWDEFIRRGGNVPLAQQALTPRSPAPKASPSGSAVTGRGESFLAKAIDFISRPLFGVTNAVSGRLDEAYESAQKQAARMQRGEGFNFSEAAKALARPAIADVGKYLEGSTEEDPEKQKYGVDLIDQVGTQLADAKGEEYTVPDFDENPWGAIARGVGGFALDMALDPLTYIPVGAAVSATKGARGLSALRKTPTLRDSKKVTERILKGKPTGYNIPMSTPRATASATDTVADAVTPATERSGISVGEAAGPKLPQNVPNETIRSFQQFVAREAPTSTAASKAAASPRAARQFARTSEGGRMLARFLRENPSPARSLAMSGDLDTIRKAIPKSFSIPSAAKVAREYMAEYGESALSFIQGGKLTAGRDVVAAIERVAKAGASPDPKDVGTIQLFAQTRQGERFNRALSLSDAFNDPVAQVLVPGTEQGQLLEGLLGPGAMSRLREVPRNRQEQILGDMREFADAPLAFPADRVSESPGVLHVMRNRVGVTRDEFDAAVRSGPEIRRTEGTQNVHHRMYPDELKELADFVGVKPGVLLNEEKAVRRHIAETQFGGDFSKVKDYAVIDGEINQFATMSLFIGVRDRLAKELSARLGRSPRHSELVDAMKYGTDGFPGLVESLARMEKIGIDSGKFLGVRYKGKEVPMLGSSVYSTAYKLVREGTLSEELADRILFAPSTSVNFPQLMEAVAVRINGGSPEAYLPVLTRQRSGRNNQMSRNPLVNGGRYGYVPNTERGILPEPLGEGMHYTRNKADNGFTAVWSGERLQRDAVELIEAIADDVGRISREYAEIHTAKSVQDAGELLLKMEATLAEALGRSTGQGIKQMATMVEEVTEAALDIGASRLAVEIATKQAAEGLPRGVVPMARQLQASSDAIQAAARSGARVDEIKAAARQSDVSNRSMWGHIENDVRKLQEDAITEKGKATASPVSVEEFLGKHGDELSKMAEKSGIQPISADEMDQILRETASFHGAELSDKEIGKILYDKFKGPHGKAGRSLRYAAIGHALRDVLGEIRHAPRAGGVARTAAQRAVGSGDHYIGTGVDLAALRANVGFARIFDWLGDTFNVRARKSVDGLDLYEIYRQHISIPGKDINNIQHAIYNLVKKHNIRLGESQETALSAAFKLLQRGDDALAEAISAGGREAELIRAAAGELRPIVGKFFDLDGAGMAGDFFWRASQNHRYIEEAWKYHKLDGIHQNPFDDAFLKGDPSAAWRDWDIDNVGEFLNNYNLAAHRALTAKVTSGTLDRALMDAGLASTVSRKGFAKPAMVGRSYLFAGLEDSALFYDRRVLDAITEIDHMVFQARRFDNQFIEKVFDPSQRAWKTAVTIYRIGHHVRNIVSNGGLSVLAEGPRNLTRSGVIAAGLLGRRAGSKARLADGSFPMGDVEALAQGLKPKMAKAGTDRAFGGRDAFGRQIDVSYEELNEQLTKRSIMRTFQQAEDFIQESTNIGNTIADKLLFTHTRFGKGLGNFSEALDHHGIAQQAIQHVMNNLHRVGRGKLRTMDDLWDQAAARAYKFHPDASSLTPFEAKYMARIIPFYTWFRGTLPAIMEASWHYPGRAAAFHKANFAVAQAQGIDAESYANPYPDELQVPEFMRERVFGANLRAGERIFGLNPGFAHLDLASDFWGTGPKTYEDGTEQNMLSSLAENAVNYGKSMTSPLLTLPYEMLSNTDFVTGEEIPDMSENVDSYLPSGTTISRLLGDSLTGSLAKGSPDPLRGVEGGWQDEPFTEEGYQLGDTQRMALFNWLSGTQAVELRPERTRSTQEERVESMMSEFLKQTQGQR